MIRHIRNFPKTLDIGENIWTVRFARRIPNESDHTLGLCDPSDYTIWIRLRQTPEERFKTLLHEVCHAICFSYNIKESHRTIHQLEEPLLRLLMDNGVFF